MNSTLIHILVSNVHSASVMHYPLKIYIMLRGMDLKRKHFNITIL